MKAQEMMRKVLVASLLMATLTGCGSGSNMIENKAVEDNSVEKTVLQVKN